MKVWPAVAWKRSAAPGGRRCVGQGEVTTVLRERWAQVKDGRGQVVLLSGKRALANRGSCRCCKTTWRPNRRRG